MIKHRDEKNQEKYFDSSKICDRGLVLMEPIWVCESWVVYTWFWGIYTKQVEKPAAGPAALKLCLPGSKVSGTIVTGVAEEGGNQLPESRTHEVEAVRNRTQ